MINIKALITGASSGIGYEMAKYLDETGYDLILVSRNKKRLDEIKKELKNKVDIMAFDLSDTDNCSKLYDKVKKMKVDIIVNNAGFGAYGDYKTDNLDIELNMIDLNVKSLHILTKLFVNDDTT